MFFLEIGFANSHRVSLPEFAKLVFLSLFACFGAFVSDCLKTQFVQQPTINNQTLTEFTTTNASSVLGFALHFKNTVVR